MAVTVQHIHDVRIRPTVQWSEIAAFTASLRDQNEQFRRRHGIPTGGI